MRPESFSREPRPLLSERLESCPFCVGNEAQTPPEVFALRPRGEADQPGWDVRVVPNKFPAFSSESVVAPSGAGLFRALPASGHHEVIIHGPDHNRYLAHMGEDELIKIFQVYQQRIRACAKDPGTAMVIIIVNQGREAGASIEHPHSQLFAVPLVPPLVSAELEAMDRHREKTGECLLCAMREAEKSSERLVADNDEFTVFCPFAARVPFEMYIVPKVHQSDFDQADQAQLASLASMIKLALGRLVERLGDPPLNIYLHTRPFGAGDYHWHIVVLPKLSVMAGFEFASDILINITDPETAAGFLR